MNKKIVLAAAIATAGIAFFAIDPAYSKLDEKGLIHPVNHFPVWFSDTKTTLQLCLDGDGVTGPCLFDAPIAGNAFSEAIGFGPEAFWWSADSVIDLPNGRGAVLVLALEAAFANEDPVDGEQFAFGRVRIRVDTPQRGRYLVWHPFIKSPECRPEVFDAPAGIRAINVTRDVGGNAPFDTMMDGEVGPFLVWDPAVAPQAPAGYVGDPQVEHPVIGSPCGFNYFRIEAVNLDGSPAAVNLDGRGNNFVQSNLFSVQGKVYQEESAPPAIKTVRGSYFRSTNTSGATTARVNVWVEAPPRSSVDVSGLPQANQNGALTHDGNGGFFRRSTLNSANGPRVPDSVSITATNAAGMSTTRTLALQDVVTVSSAVWSPSASTLTVVALSSDRVRSGAAPPTLSLRAGGRQAPMSLSNPAAGRYTHTFSDVTTPPASVAVTSSRGGSATAPVAD